MHEVFAGRQRKRFGFGHVHVDVPLGDGRFASIYPFELEEDLGAAHLAMLDLVVVMCFADVEPLQLPEALRGAPRRDDLELPPNAERADNPPYGDPVGGRFVRYRGGALRQFRG